MSTPTPAQVIKDMIEARVAEMHTSMPAQVVKVDVASAKCDVQPVIKRKYADGRIVKLPVITNVPIAVYRAGKAFISLPVKVGDYVKLEFSERSMDSWLKSGGLVDPRDGRKHHLSDAIAYPGVYPFSDPPEGATSDDVIIKNDKSKVTVKPTGKFLFNGESEEIMDLLVEITDRVLQVTDKLSTTTTNTIFGAMQLNDFMFFAIKKIEIQQLKQKLETLKG